MLEFPNPIGKFCDAANAVRFVGHDGMFEVPFFVETTALVWSGKTHPSECDFLAAFYSVLSSINDIARNAYSYGRRTSFTLTAADFR